MENRRPRNARKADLEAADVLIRTLSEFCSRMEPRTSIRQALAFALIARAHFARIEITIADLQKNDRDAGVLGEFFGQSMARTHIALQEKGWITFGESPGDRRKKVVELTPEGIRVAARLITHLKR